MPKLDLAYSEVVQGEFDPASLNVLLTFQVNCPGCFVYSLPFAQKLYERGLKVFGLSTAFEDFELNTLENTKLLLEEGTIVGETKKALNSMGHENYPNAIEFPVLFDKLVSPEEFLEAQPELIPEAVSYVKSLKYLPYTFTVNGFGGTPTWVIFDAEFEILAAWFGQRPFEEIEWIIESIPKT